MKICLFTLIAAIVACTTTFAQPTLQWDSNFNAGGNDQGNDIAVDGNGNVYVTGTSDGANFVSDYLTIKYNSNGDTLWTRRFNGNANGIDEAYSIKVDPAGNVYVTGKSATPTTGYNIVTIKYNASGVQQWVANFDAGNSGSNRDDIGLNILVDIAGYVYVVGTSFSPGGFNYSQGVAIKYNAFGVKQWHTHIGNSGTIAKLIKQNTFGNIIVPTGIEQNDSYYYKIYVINPTNGNVLQTYNQDFDPVPGHPEDMILDASGNIYLTSTSHYFCSTPIQVHTAKFSYAAPPQTPPSHSWDSWTYVGCGDPTLEGVGMKMDVNLNLYVLSDFFNSIKHNFYLKKYNPNGGTYWALTQPSTTDDTPVSLALGSLSDPAAPDIYVTGNTSTGLIRTLKYHNDSTLLWSKTYACGNGIAAAAKMVMDDCDNIYITGFSTCDGTFKDIITIKYSASSATITPGGTTTFCQGGSVTLTASLANAYLWSTGATTQSIVVSSAGNYAVTVTNANGCTAASSGTTVIDNPSPSAVVTPNGPTTFCQGGSVTLTAPPGNTYQWSNNATSQSIPISTSGNYLVTVTNANGCSAISAATGVIVNASPSAMVTPSGPTTFCQGGSVTLTVPPGNTYHWSNNATTPSIPVSTSGNYLVTVTNANGCSAISTPTPVTVNPSPSAMVTPSGPTTFCQGGSVTLTAPPGNIYHWSNNATAPSITVSNTEIYSVTVTNANGCSAISTPTSVTVNPLPSAVVTPSGPTTFCQGGSVTLTAPPGNTYHWSNNATSPSIPVSNTGIYTVTVTDANGCSAISIPTSVSVNLVPIVMVNSPTICPGQPATLTASGAATYLWSNGMTGSSIIVGPNDPTTNTVTGTTAGCSSSPVATQITINPTPTVNAVSSQTVCKGSATFATFGGSVPGTVFNWANSNTNIGLAASGTGNIPAFIATNSGNTPVLAAITVTPSYTNGGVTCTGTPATFTITVNPAPTVNAASQTVCNGEAAAVTFMGSVPGTEFNWINNNPGIGLAASGSGNISSFIATNTGTAPVTVMLTVTPTYTNNNVTCTGTPTTFTLTVNPTPTLNPVSNQAVCNGAATVVNFSGSVSGTVFNWINNNPSIGLAASGMGNITSFIAINTGNAPVTATFTVTPSYTNGGVAFMGAPTAFTITVHQSPTVELGPPITLQTGQQATLSAPGTWTEYLWSTGATTATIDVDTAGTYAVTVTNSDGCTATDFVVVNVIVPTTDFDKRYRISISPNPAQHTINIKCEGNATTSVQVFDMLGSLVIEDNTFVADGAVRTISLDGVPSGAYQVKVVGEGFIRVVSVVKT